MKPRIGVDISSTAVRLARVDGIDKDGFAQVSRLAYIPLKHGAVDTGRIKSPAAVAAALQNGLKKIGGTRTPIVLGATDPDSAVTRVAVPAEIPADRRVAVLTTNQQKVAAAIPTAEAQLATSFVRTDTVDGREMASLVVAAARTTEIDALYGIAESAKARLDRVDLSAAGLFRALVRDEDESTELGAIVDVGATTTRVLIREGLNLRSVRVIPIGGFEMTRALATALKTGLVDAEQAKYTYSLGETGDAVQVTYGGLTEDATDDRTESRAAGMKAITIAADGLIDQITNAVTMSAPAGGTVEQVALVGGVLLHGGFRARLARRLDTPVRAGAPWAHVTENKHTATFFESNQIRPAYLLAFANAIGLGTTGATS